MAGYSVQANSSDIGTAFWGFRMGLSCIGVYIGDNLFMETPQNEGEISNQRQSRTKRHVKRYTHCAEAASPLPRPGTLTPVAVNSDALL